VQRRGIDQVQQRTQQSLGGEGGACGHNGSATAVGGAIGKERDGIRIVRP
jgi:hypothetical protein